MMIQAFISGLLYPFRALGMLARTPRLWPFVLIPFVVNIVVGVTLYAGLLLGGFRGIDAFVAGLPEWAAALGALLRVLLIIGLLIVTGFVLVRFGVVLGSPWYARLSDQLETTLIGRPPASSSFLRDLGRAVSYELKKLLLVLLVGAVLLLLNLIPVVGTIASTAGGIGLGATVACLDFFDYPLERRSLSFREKLGTIRRTLPASAGFGLMCLGLVSIPFVNLLSIPICVVAGTLFFCDWIWDRERARA
jgi:CysZ protein